MLHVVYPALFNLYYYNTFFSYDFFPKHKIYLLVQHIILWGSGLSVKKAFTFQTFPPRFLTSPGPPFLLNTASTKLSFMFRVSYSIAE